jgi:hypothetical protein
VVSISGTVLVVAAVVVLVIVVAVAALLVARARSRPGGGGAMPSPGDPPAAGAYLCPFCKRPYAPAQTGNRCPSCGAATPRS